MAHLELSGDVSLVHWRYWCSYWCVYAGCCFNRLCGCQMPDVKSVPFICKDPPLHVSRDWALNYGVATPLEWDINQTNNATKRSMAVYGSICLSGGVPWCWLSWGPLLVVGCCWGGRVRWFCIQSWTHFRQSKVSFRYLWCSRQNLFPPTSIKEQSSTHTGKQRQEASMQQTYTCAKKEPLPSSAAD